jgi:polyhydroxyalkanoate synthesis repressor PhaR
MADEPIQIKRYPNRRFYSREARKYVSLEEIEALVRDGKSVDIQDSQTGQSLTRAVLAQIILDRQPEKMSLFPVDMLHGIVRANDAAAGFLRDYFRQSLTYLDFLQRHGSTAREMASPMHWMKLWMDGLKNAVGGKKPQQQGDSHDAAPSAMPAMLDPQMLLQRIAELEERLEQLESRKAE